MITSLTEYRNLSHDYYSYDGDVLAVLVEAQQEIERLTDRFFEEDTYTEILPVHCDRVYPRATPILSVSAPLNTEIDGAAIVHTSGWPGINLSNSWSLGVTYIGGYAEADMPIELKRLVADLAFRLAPPPEAASVPMGVTSMTVGDIKLQGHDLGRPQDVMTGSLRLRIARWRRAEEGSSVHSA